MRLRVRVIGSKGRKKITNSQKLFITLSHGEKSPEHLLRPSSFITTCLSGVYACDE